MQWLFLLIAGLFEVQWAVCLKFSEGFSRLIPASATVAGMIASFWFLSLALKSLPLGTAYAVWTGIGAVGTALLGMYLFGEARDAARLVCIALIVSGIVGLKLVSPE